ncbi:hypothetical protein EVAR_27981_1 [Eumeta japonica]|uniref:Uncharacterized protein n=1 Tax=Eumeta variegata TaxID=151549 RepID=A0A4C1WEP6_EUMVA|nr:hypothetical protein EVAR_27981_1 [Eumeta japonica]
MQPCFVTKGSPSGEAADYLCSLSGNNAQLSPAHPSTAIVRVTSRPIADTRPAPLTKVPHRPLLIGAMGHGARRSRLVEFEWLKAIPSYLCVPDSNFDHGKLADEFLTQSQQNFSLRSLEKHIKALILEIITKVMRSMEKSATAKINFTRCYQSVTHPSTGRVQRRLTSVIGGEPVYWDIITTWYGRGD